MGKKVIALLTDMDEPLGNMVGNFLEIEESLDCLEGKGPADLMEVTLELAARMVMLAGQASEPVSARKLCEAVIASGKARELFMTNVKSQGGDPVKLASMRGSFRSPFSAVVKAGHSGFISRIDALAVGSAGVELGVGRNRTEDRVSPDVGVCFRLKSGDAVRSGDTIMEVWAKDRESLETALPRLGEAVSYSDAKNHPRILVRKEIRS
jgi:pyrimidine-nucleoside phosphorylase